MPVTVSRHARATADGAVTFDVHGAPPGAKVTLTSARRIPSRWLARGRPRIVKLGSAPADATVTIRLSREHFALLRRMRTLHAVAHIAGDGKRAITLHACSTPG